MITPRKIHRGMYVSPMSTSIGAMLLPPSLRNILASATNTQALLDFISKYQFDSLSLYDLPTISAQDFGSQLASFMKAARALGVGEINAIIGSSSDLKAIQNFYLGTTTSFDGIVTEIEFWNSSNVNSSFQSFITTLQQISLSQAFSPVVTPYIGWLNNNPGMTEAQEAAAIAANSSRVFCHAYVKSPGNALGYIQSRLTALQAAKPSLPVWPIFSAEGTQYKAGSEIFMGDWLAANGTGTAPLDLAESLVMQAGYTPAGFQWFHHVFLTEYLK